jgi:ubiquitin-conjugating enzyme E2 Q
LQDLSGVTSGTVLQLLQVVASATNPGASDDDMDTNQSGSDFGGTDGYSDPANEDEEDDWPEDDVRPATNAQYRAVVTDEFIEHIRSDLRTVKAAGFKVSCVSDILEGSSCYISISCRACKLGISGEAMQAWEIDANDYITLVLYYPVGYKTLISLRSIDTRRVQELVKIHVGKSQTYKAAAEELKDLFHDDRVSNVKDLHHEEEPKSRTFEDLFISKPLNALLNDRLVSLIDHRLNHGLTWGGAEDFYDKNQGRIRNESFKSQEHADFDTGNDSYSGRVAADHLTMKSSTATFSFPLIAMQFFLRHLVRCTEFCLVCHCKVEGGLEAIKPYVCDKPLCLYQYMSLGFGPSIEHEICSQPRVVDLLISFCYASARAGRLHDFPTGMDIRVPGLGYEDENEVKQIQAKWIPAKKLLEFDSDRCPVKVGDWIMITEKQLGTYHARVEEISSYPLVVIGTWRVGPKPRMMTQPYTYKAKTFSSLKDDKSEYSIWISLYNVRFDELEEDQRRFAINQALDMLLPVEEMQKKLQSRVKTGWGLLQEEIPSASLSILRWIIASSRACILEVGSPSRDKSGEWKSQSAASDRLGGMDGWLQFRFAMGAPDKERRFQAEVQSVIKQKNPQYPTFFAWHGSPLKNWHGIVREGLRYDLGTSHGRSFGNGVYHSLDANVSLGYSSYGSFHHSTGYDGVPLSWPGSVLSIQSAIALNEIVNAPSEFVSRTPHFVVQHRDWIQTRYLLVNCSGTNRSPDATPQPSNAATSNETLFQQDPEMTPSGIKRNPITIPESAVSRSRRRNSVAIPIGNKRLKGDGSMMSPFDLDADEANFQDDGASICTADSDAAIIEPQETSKGATSAGLKGNFGKIPYDKDTSYVPYTLDRSNLPIMGEPHWASPVASKRLLQELRDVLKIQTSERPSVLGWHVDDRFGDNLYQWIVELHSFDKDLPLADDMKRSNINSIVLEMRFGPSFPLSPPFVRVISPRFLSFLQGGGGHVTAGGAMCMELLTNAGWSPAQSIENVILQVRMAITSTEPKPARLLMASSSGGQASTYGVHEATAAFVRACNVHGWEIPPDFHEIARASGVRG